MTLGLEPQDAPARDAVRGTLRVALLGFGTVGRAVARALVEPPPTGPLPVELVSIYNRGIDRKRASWVPSRVEWTESVERAFADDIDAVVELVGGLDPAGDWVARALATGKSVVTANKQLIAERGAALEAQALERGVEIRFEAAVCGGVPVINALRTGLRGDRIQRLAGLLNGTANFILTAMDREGQSLDEALAEAIDHGYAEADPTADVDGLDALAKVRILAREALGWEVAASDFTCHSLRGLSSVDFRYARRLGCTIRQVAWVGRDPHATDEAAGAVGPMLVPRRSPLASVAGRDNLLVTWGQRGGPTRFAGRGAGGDATAVAVVSDLLHLAIRGPRSGAAAEHRPVRLAGGGLAPRYVRLTVNDRPGILAALTAAFARHGINVDAVLQEPGFPKGDLPFVVTLEACRVAELERALAEIREADFHVAPPLALAIFDVHESTTTA
ncbi:MAG: homoserine dehydrogenase [Vicinamibacterales bacterium]